MKYILSLLTLALPITAQTNLCDELDGEPDLFKRYDQICAGSVDLLYWTVAEGALDYAEKMQQEAWGPTPSFAQGNMKRAKFDLDPGVRVGFLFFRAPHYWEIRWEYTRMTCHGKDHAMKPGALDQFLTGTFPQIMIKPLTGAHSRIHLNYNVFDYTVDRVFFPNPHLRLRVLGGASLAWINQDWRVRYNDADANSTSIRNRWNFTGAGLKTGIIVDWYWTGAIYMTSHAIWGAMLGNYVNRAKETTTFQTGSDNPGIPVRNLRYNDARAVTTAQLIFGPSYQQNFCHTRLEIFCGFEMNVWGNLQEVYRSTQNLPSLDKQTWINTGLLTLYGLTAKASLDF